MNIAQVADRLAKKFAATMGGPVWGQEGPDRVFLWGVDR